MARFTIECSRIRDSDSFHDEFARALGFFDGYGRNMNAWIDCMSDFQGLASCAAPLPVGEPIELVLRDAEAFCTRCPDLAADLFECTAFVNRRYATESAPERVSLIPE